MTSINVAHTTCLVKKMVMSTITFMLMVMLCAPTYCRPVWGLACPVGHVLIATVDTPMHCLHGCMHDIVVHICTYFCICRLGIVSMEYTYIIMMQHNSVHIVTMGISTNMIA